MVKTKRRKKSTTYELALGNTEERSGHRRDCAQLSAVIRMEYEGSDEHSPELALQLVKDTIDGETFVVEVYEGVTIEFVVNASRATKKDVTS